MNVNGDCNLIFVKGELDHEVNDKYNLDVKLNTLSAYANPNKMNAKVSLNKNCKRLMQLMMNCYRSLST